MKKDDVFKEGANSVAKTMEKKYMNGHKILVNILKGKMSFL